jgi:signal transduction histidine kinase
MGGTVTVDSQVGKGSCFTVLLRQYEPPAQNSPLPPAIPAA